MTHRTLNKHTGKTALRQSIQKRSVGQPELEKILHFIQQGTLFTVVTGGSEQFKTQKGMIDQGVQRALLTGKVAIKGLSLTQLRKGSEGMRESAYKDLSHLITLLKQLNSFVNIRI